MREASAKGPAIDLSEFERRLRGPEPAKRSGHDPLAELARLLHGDGAAAAAVRDPYRDVFAEEPPTRAPRAAPRVPQPQQPTFNEEDFVAERAPAAPRAAPRVPQLQQPTFNEEDFAAERAPAAPRAAPRVPQPQQPIFNEDDFVADLRASFEPSTPNPPASQRRQAPQQRGAPREFPAAPQRFEAPERSEAPQRSEARQRFEAPPRSEPPQRFEQPRPRFEQPYREARHEPNGFRGPNANDWGNDESQTYLDYGAQESEQDYDYEQDYYESERRPNRLKIGLVVAGIVILGGVSIGWGFAHRGGGAPQEIATIAAPEGPAKVPPVGGDEQQEQQGAAVLDRNENATVRNVVAHEEQPVDPTATAATRALRSGAGQADASPADNAPLVQEPKRVKTVSVRPDGTVIANDTVPTAAVAPSRPLRAAPRDPAPDDVAETQGGTPRNVAASPPVTTPRAAKPAKPAKVAVVEPPPPPIVENDDAGAAPSENAADPAPAPGTFAVQFGAAASEAEARTMMESVMGKYGPQLGGRRLGYRHAKVGEKSVYRVRVGGVSKESAVGICEKVKAAGGNCFVAPN
jgi:hypothetical protein